MIKDFLLQLIIIVIGLIPIGVVHFLAKKNELLVKEIKHKEKYYLNYIEAISNFVISENSEKAQEQMADTSNTILLIGSADVINNLMIFHNYLKKETSNFNQQEHDKRLTELLKSMRNDLYKNKKINENYPIVSLTTSKKI